MKRKRARCPRCGRAFHRTSRDASRYSYGGVRMCPCPGETRAPQMLTYDPEDERFSRDPSRARRDTDLQKLAWLARRRGPRGREALQVFQDALMEKYGPQFERAIDYANSREGAEKPKVIFLPARERNLLKATYPAGYGTFGPFVVRYQEHNYRGAVVVYEPGKGLRPRRTKRVYRKRPWSPMIT